MTSRAVTSGLPIKPQLLTLLKIHPTTHNFFRDLLRAHEERRACSVVLFSLPLIPSTLQNKPKKPDVLLKNRFKWTATMNFLLPPPLAGISKLPSWWTKVTEDSLLQKNVVSRKLAVLSSVLNKWNLARVRPVKTIKGTLYLERQGGFSHMLKPNRLQTSSGSAVSRSVNLLWAPVQFFLLQQTQFSNF